MFDKMQIFTGVAISLSLGGFSVMSKVLYVCGWFPIWVDPRCLMTIYVFVVYVIMRPSKWVHFLRFRYIREGLQNGWISVHP